MFTTFCGYPCLQHDTLHFVLPFKVDGVCKPIDVLEDTTIVCFYIIRRVGGKYIASTNFALQGCE